MLEKTNLLILGKEAAENENESLKIWLLLSTYSHPSGKINEETIWKEQGFLSDEELILISIR